MYTNTNKKDYDNAMRAVYISCTSELNGMIKGGLDVTSLRGELNETLLMRAAQVNAKLPIVKRLISAGIDVNARNTFGRSALHEAAAKGNVRTCELLIDAGANLDVSDIDGCTPLHEAASMGHKNVIKLLVSSGADTTLTETFGRTPKQMTNRPACIAAFG